MRIRLPAALAALAVAACGGGTDRSGLSAVTAAPSTAVPGLTLELTGAVVAEGAAPVVTFRATDGAGAPLDLAAEIAAGRVSPRFVLARRLADGTMASYLVAHVSARPYVDASGATVQPTGTATQAIAEPPYGAWPLARLVAKGNGEYAYTFAAPVTGVAPDATHLAGMWATRTTDGVGAPATATLDFVPAGGTPAPREEVVAAACERCHGPLLHHDQRRGPKLCLACHTTQTSDPETGTALDLTTMVHRIHKGARLSRPLVTVGYQQRLHDYGHVLMAPSHSTSFELGTTGAAAVNDPGIVRNCGLCHQGAEADRWKTAPSAAACGACHDRVDFTTGTHAGGVPTGSTDADCARCHVAGESSTPPTARVHSEAYETTRNLLFAPPPFSIRILSVDGAVAGSGTPPTVDFEATLDGKPYDVLANAVDGQPLATGSLGALAFQLAGPTTDYATTWPTTAGVSSALLAGKADPAKVSALGAPGTFRFTFPAAIPATMSGTWAVSFEAYWREEQVAADGAKIRKPRAASPVFHGPSRNVAYVDVATGAPSAAERRAVVSTDKCNACHEDLGFHSNRSRKGLDYCATCHAPNLSNAARARFKATDARVLTASGVAMPSTPVFVAESVASKVFIHRIHMGAELPSVKAGGRVFFGANRTASDPTPGGEGLSEFTGFESPHPVADCTACHLDGTWRLPDAPGLLPVRRALLDCGETDAAGWCKGRTPNAVVRELVTPALKAVCTSCHDDPASSAHADLNTVRPNAPDAVEACAGCHGEGKAFDALRVHAAP